jgi:hypothetical protein
MNKAGMSPNDIDESFQSAMGALSTRLQRGINGNHESTSEIGCDTIAGAVLRAWHREPNYLDDFANPVPLLVSGRRMCLASLIKAQDPQADFAGLIRAMHRTGLVRKIGDKYLPTTSAATISQMHPFAIDHVVKTVMRLVETVTRNMQLVDSKHPLVERYAHIPDLDAKEARAFSDFSRQQGAACLEAIEDWLEARRKARPSRAKGTRESLNAGMHVFAYIEQPSQKKKNIAARKKAKATSSRAARA